MGGPTLLVENRSASHLSTDIDRYSPAFKRFSAAGQKLVQAHHGGRSFPFAASDAAVEEAQDVVRAVGALVPEPLYRRVDGVYLGNVFHVTEIEGVEPYLEMSNAFFPSEVVTNAVGAIYSRFTLRRFPYES